MKLPPKHCYKCDGDIAGVCALCGRPFCESHGNVANMVCVPHFWIGTAVIVSVLAVVLGTLWYFYG